MTKNQEPRIYVDVSNVKCPICNGFVNSKWFSFRNQNTVEFIAECWTPENPDLPRHIFYFQIKTPDCVLFDKEGSQKNHEVKG